MKLIKRIYTVVLFMAIMRQQAIKFNIADVKRVWDVA